MKCLVTGAAGGIGHHLCEQLLRRGHSVVGWDDYSAGNHRPSGVSMRTINIYSEPLPATSFDWIFHLAAKADIVPSITDPLAYHNTNVTGTVRMLEYARKIKAKRFIYAASSSCYGIPDDYPTTETAECRPQYPYALTKYLGEQYVLHYAKVYGLPAISLRLFNVFGPGFRTAGAYGAVFGTFLAQLANSHPLTVVGDGTQKRDFIYVTDVCRAMIHAARSNISGEVFNVGTGKPQSINKLVELLVGKGANVVNLPKRPGEPAKTCASRAKIKRMLGWDAHISFENGVKHMLKRLDDYKDAPLWTPNTINEATKEWFQCLNNEK